mmetsp:Transcript_34380/g.72913  ORF Transcript_34380/g.72913 Transcript_34380/m.72913 type:complete len:736 (+) Transcript_34380:56-2263(+)
MLHHGFLALVAAQDVRFLSEIGFPSHTPASQGGILEDVQRRWLQENDTVLCRPKPEEEPEEKTAMQYVFTYGSIVVLVSFSGLFSGLTLGLLGLDMNGLEIVAKGDNAEMAQCAIAIQPVRRNGNMLLCTLLLGNVAVNTMLAILVDSVFTGFSGFLLSTVVIVVFGEIIPQATCSRYALQIGRRSVPIVMFLRCVMYPFTRPLALALDYALGQELGEIHSKANLVHLMKIHERHHAVGEITGQAIKGALEFKEKLVSEIMIPVHDVFMLPITTVLDFDTVTLLFKRGYSRVPVYGAATSKAGKATITDVSPVKHVTVDVPSRTKFFAVKHPFTVGTIVMFREVHSEGPITKASGHTVVEVYEDGFAIDFDSKATPITLGQMAEAAMLDKNEIVGLLLTKDLIFVEPERSTPLAQFMKVFQRQCQRLRVDQTVGEAFQAFKRARAHIAVVRSVCTPDDADPYFVVEGVVTLEDVIEQIIGDDIVDEYDPDPEGVADTGLSDGAPKFDFTKLRLFNHQDAGAELSTEELHTLALHLMQTVPFFRSLTRGQMCKLVELANLVTLRKEDATSAFPCSNDFLYERGVEVDMCTVVLTGRITVLAGRDEFQSEAGTFMVVASGALVSSGPFLPDFSAYVATSRVRCLQIPRATYDQVLSDGAIIEPTISSAPIPRKRKSKRQNSAGRPDGDISRGGGSGPVTSTLDEEAKHEGARPQAVSDPFADNAPPPDRQNSKPDSI